LGTRLLFAALLATLLFPLPARASFPGLNGRIAFQSVQDGNAEIYSVNPDGTDATRLTNDPASDVMPAWSPDGTKIVFSSDRDNHSHLLSMNADGSGLTQLTFGSPSDTDPAWAPEGTKIVFRSSPATSDSLMVMNADGTAQHSIFNTAYSERAPAWSPTGEPIALDLRDVGGSVGVWTVRPDGSNGTRISILDGSRPDWSPDGQRLVYDAQQGFFGRPKGLVLANPMTGSESSVPNTTDLTDPVFSPDGTRLAATNGTSVYTLNLDGTDRRLVAAGTAPNWQTIDPPPYPGPSYPKPRGASPMQVSLVPVYQECTAAPGAQNDSHGAPLAFPSCNPPQYGAWNLTMGTPDANGAGAQFVGSLTFKVVTDNPGTGADEADVRVTATLSDVRCKFTVDPEEPGTEGFPCRAGEMADYTGEIQGNPLVRITDTRNGYEANRPGTGQDVRFPFTIPCAATSSDLVGASCAVSTTFDSVVPGAIAGGARAIWAVQRADVHDGGVDGVASTQANNGPFVTQGIFVP
jgi:hypothetical protein